MNGSDDLRTKRAIMGAGYGILESQRREASLFGVSRVSLMKEKLESTWMIPHYADDEQLKRLQSEKSDSK